MNEEWTKTNLPIKALRLWDENARFPEEYFNKTQEELIEYFLSKKNFKIKELAQEIVDEFDLPQLEKIVVLEINDEKVVLEGNRRLTVYKLLSNPLLTTNKNTQKAFAELKSKYNIDDDFQIEVLTTKSKEEGLRFLNRKHNKNNNEVPWGEVERRNFAVRRTSKTSKDTLRVELANIVKKLSLPDIIKEEVLGKGFVTTFYRIIDGDDGRNKLGYSLKDGSIKIKENKKFGQLLKTVAFNVWNKKDFRGQALDSRTLNTKTQIEQYLLSLKPEDSSRVDKEIKKMTNSNLFGNKMLTKSSVKKSKTLSMSRKFLINSPFYISEDRLNKIYYELKGKLIVDETPNAVAVLFRVFFEGSLDCYISKKQINLKKYSSHNPSLSEKLRAVANNLKLTPNEMKIINKAISSKNTIYSVDTFNAYVHNTYIHPSPIELKNAWDEFKAFFEKLWGNMGK